MSEIDQKFDWNLRKLAAKFHQKFGKKETENSTEIPLKFH